MPEIDEETAEDNKKKGLSDQSRQSIRSGSRSAVNDFYNKKKKDGAAPNTNNATKPTAPQTQSSTAKKPETASTPKTPAGENSTLGSANKAYKYAQLAKDIKENPQEAAKEAAKEAGKEVAKKEIKKQISKTGLKSLLGIGGETTGAAAGAALSWEVILVIIVVLAVIAIVLFIIGFVIGFYSGGSTLNRSTGTINGNVEQSIAYPLMCTEDAMAQAINDFIDRCEAGTSPLHGRGDLFVAAGKESGLNPFLIAAQACKENQFGTTGYAKNHPGSYNTFGHKYGSYTKDYGVAGPVSPEGDRYMIYPSWEASLKAHANILSNYIKKGRTTLTAIIDKYQTGSTATYVGNLNTWMSELFNAAGCAPSSSGTSISGPTVSSSPLDSIIASSGFNGDDVAYAIVGDSGSAFHNADALMTSASSIKADILLAYLYNNNVPTSGSSIDQAVSSMITNSNNNSANTVIDAVGGLDAVNTTLASHGISGAQLNRRLGASSSQDNLLSANGAVQTMQSIMQLPDDKRRYALDALFDGDTGTGQDYIRSALTGATVYSKSGQGIGNGARNDIAIIQDGDNYSYIAVLVKTDSGNVDAAQKLIGDIAKRGIVIADSSASINCY